MKCINCNNDHDGLFCPNCGEKLKVPKITLSSILKEGITTIMSMDRGFLFLLKNLFLKPREIINGYISGKRKYIYNPVSYLIIAISVYLIGDSFIVVESGGEEVKSKIFSVGYEAGKFIKSNMKYFWIFAVLWLSLSTKVVFGKYNFAEHLAINSFVIGQSTLIGFLGFLLLKLPLVLNPIIYASIIWMIYQIYRSKENDFNTFLSACASAFLFFIQLGLLSILIGVIRSY